MRVSCVLHVFRYYNGLDPLFDHLVELLIIGVNTVFVVTNCVVLYFDSHYHTYVIKIGMIRKVFSL